MPTYEYECKSCAHSFEAIQSMAEDPLKECPECGKEVRRVIGGGMGIIFKGSGFYVTDNRGGTSESKAGNGDGGASGDKGSSGDNGNSGDKASTASKDSGPKSDSSKKSSPDSFSSDSKSKQEVKS